MTYPTSVGTGDLLPPLAVISTRLDGDGVRLMHPIDLAFLDVDVRRVESGSTSINGHTVTVLTKVDRVRKTFGQYSVYRIFSDMNRGALPLRMEVFNCSNDDETDMICGLPPDRLCDGLAIPFPQQLVVGVQVQEVSPGFFYPTEGEIQELGAGRMVNGTVKGLLPHHTTKWSTYRVESSRPMSVAMFESKFPTNTLVHYKSTNENKLTGELDDIGELVTRPIASRTTSNHPWTWHWWVAALVPLLLLSIWQLRRRA